MKLKSVWTQFHCDLMLNQIVLMMFQFRLQPKFRFLENMAQWLLFMEIQAHITGLCSSDLLAYFWSVDSLEFYDPIVKWQLRFEFDQSYNSGCSWNQLIDSEVIYVSYIQSNDLMLLILNDNNVRSVKMFAPGNDVKSFAAENLDQIPSKMWFWEDTIEYIGSENQIKRATPTLACARLAWKI